MEEKKEKFLGTFAQMRGLITLTCATVKIARGTYYNWLKTDAEFKRRAEDVLELQVDFVESKLLDLINAGDTTAVIFYLKTKGKNRGYSDKAVQPTENSVDMAISDNSEKKATFKRKIRQISGKIKKMLEKSDRYSSDLDYQIDITAQLIAKTDELKEDIFSDGHKSVITEFSREGNEREIISQKEKLYLDYAGRVQGALSKLGMIVDPKNKNTGEDGFNEFMESMKG